MENLTLYQASRLCGVSPKTVSSWIEKGDIQAVSTTGGHRRIKRKDVLAFLRRHGMPLPSGIEETKDVKRILVIDDDSLIVETIVTSLEEEPHNYEVVSASDGFEAALQISQFKPDLLILDIMMPDVDGHEVCLKVKQDPATSHTKIIVLSGYMDESNHDRMKENGADACYSKPLSLRSLKKHVVQMLGLEGS